MSTTITDTQHTGTSCPSHPSTYVIERAGDDLFVVSFYAGTRWIGSYPYDSRGLAIVVGDATLVCTPVCITQSEPCWTCTACDEGRYDNCEGI